MGENLHPLSGKKSEASLLLPVSRQVNFKANRFTQELSSIKSSDFPSVFTVKADLAVSGNVTVGTKDQFDLSLRDPPSSRVATTTKGKEEGGRYSRNIYDYDPGAEAPLRG